MRGSHKMASIGFRLPSRGGKVKKGKKTGGGGKGKTLW